MDTLLNLGMKKRYNVEYSHMNCDLALKPYSLLNYLQDIASENAEQLGFGYSYISKKNLAWFLIKYRMEFGEYPVGVYDLTISTKPRGYNKLFAYREFELSDSQKVFAKIFSMWTVVDLDKRTPVLVNSAIDNPNMSQYQKQENDLSFSKIRPLSNIDNQKEFQVRYNDLDVNGHANNGNYVIWAFETLNREFLNNHKIKTLDMMFKKEAKYDEAVISQVEFIEDNKTLHRIINKDSEDLCILECEWK
ncbi:MAG: hypothetical protein IKL52_02640 [Candidatus Gastranaerophilales bacterium]|nr:hypothetical protein [Candidatus Gastranaerophilales bacterium]